MPWRSKNIFYGFRLVSKYLGSAQSNDTVFLWRPALSVLVLNDRGKIQSLFVAARDPKPVEDLFAELKFRQENLERVFIVPIQSSLVHFFRLQGVRACEDSTLEQIRKGASYTVSVSESGAALFRVEHIQSPNMTIMMVLNCEDSAPGPDLLIAIHSEFPKGTFG